MKTENIIICFTVIFLLVVIFYFIKKIYFKKKYTIICARYNKNTDFLDILSKKFDVKIIQKKGVSYNNKYVDHLVVNKAHEATSYLSYIIKYYDNLPDNMIFIHDENKSWHHEGLITDNIYEWIDMYETTNGYYEFNNKKTDQCSWCYKRDVFNKLWEELFPNRKLEKHNFNGKCCAQFIISKERILKNSKDFYMKYYNWLVTYTQDQGNGNIKNFYSGYWTSRYAEWLWKVIFD